MRGLERSEASLIEEATSIFLKDIYDHAIQIIDTTETFRDMFSSMLEMYVTSVNNRMNEIMKVLTVIATIFMPLTFIVGFCGMNFEYMPELKWILGYPIVIAAMLCISIALLGYFKKKKWI